MEAASLSPVIDRQIALMVSKISRFRSAEVDGSIARSNKAMMTSGISSLGKAPALLITVSKHHEPESVCVLTKKPTSKALPNGKLRQLDHLD